MPQNRRLLVLLAAALACGEARQEGVPADGTPPPGPPPAPRVLRAPAARTASEPTDYAAEPTSEFGRLIDRLSEPGGFFPSDNLVSNETSYLHVLGTLAERRVRGGAYVGVGPDQNFSYIAAIRPEIAFIIDIRRDNLLHHFLFKALFDNARNRLEFLCLMLGKPVPEDLARWDDATIDEIVLYVDTTRSSITMFEEADSKILESVQRYGYPLSAADLGTIRGIHGLFFDYGLNIRYSNRRRGRYPRFPTWRLLMVETDLSGEKRSYLASEESFRYLKTAQSRDLIVPVVGDLAGPHALAAIGREVAARGLVVSALYISNVEQYLMQGRDFDRFAETVTGLPYDDTSVIIRSYFARRWPIPQTVPGHFSTQLLIGIGTFVHDYREQGYVDYLDLVTRNTIPLEGLDRTRSPDSPARAVVGR